jgi:transposase
MYIFDVTFHIFTIGEVWNLCDLQQIDMPPELREKQLQKTLRRAAKLLVAHSVIAQDSIHLLEPASS